MTYIKHCCKIGDFKPIFGEPTKYRCKVCKREIYKPELIDIIK